MFRGSITEVARRGVNSADSELEELRSALAREERIARALREVGNALGTTLELDDLLELILGRLTDLLEADRSTLYLLDESSGDLVSRIVVGEQIRSIRIKVGHGIAGMVAKTGKPIRIRDAYQDPKFEPEWDILTGFRTTSMLAAPLKNHLGRTIGVIQVLNKRTADEFTFEDEAILAALSTQAAVAIDNSRLFLSLIQKNRQLLDTKVQLEHRVKDLELLFELERATARAASVDDLVLAALRAATKAAEGRGGALLVAEDGSGDLVQYVHDAESDGPLERFGLKSGEGLLARAMGGNAVVRLGPAEPLVGASDRVEGRMPFPVESALALPLDGDGEPLGALGVFSKRGGRAFSAQDTSLLELVAANVSTALRLFRASAARERSERLTSIGHLLSQVVHDFKTPMTVISGYVQLMTRADGRGEREEYGRQILKQFEVLTSMQREVLEFARGERNVFVRKVYLHKFFSDLEQQIERELVGRPIVLEMDVDRKVVTRFDEGRMARAIHNLARNAIEAMGERGGKLTIRGRKAEGALVLEVADTGPGIPSEIQGRLFQSFVTSGKKDGTGLGLAIVKKIVEEHGGTVSARSGPEGATFVLTLPDDATGGTRSAPPVTKPSRPLAARGRGAQGLLEPPAAKGKPATKAGVGAPARGGMPKLASAAAARPVKATDASGSAARKRASARRSSGAKGRVKRASRRSGTSRKPR